MSKEAVSAADAAAGLQILAEVIERGLNIVERDCEVFGRPVPTGAEIQMMVRRQDVLDIRAVLSERDAHVQAVEALRAWRALFWQASIDWGNHQTWDDAIEAVDAALAALAAVDEASRG